MSYEVVLTDEANAVAREHLLQHYDAGINQEDLCFALWRPSTGISRKCALIDRIVLPNKEDRILHGNASFQPNFLSRVVELAMRNNAGMAFMHSHPSAGWQGMSAADIEAERDILAYPAGATKLPLVGLTIGTDGHWSARFWERHGAQMRRYWCRKARVIGSQSYSVYFNDHLAPPQRRTERLRRTFDTWGTDAQGTIARLTVGIVGLGSVGCIVAEAMARIGVTHMVLIDPDRVEEHNLDRLLYGTMQNVGERKVDVAAHHIQRSATANGIELVRLALSIHEESAYLQALDCDILFSCVDRPVARDVLNYIAYSHLIPVIDGGVSIEFDERRNRLFSAHWRVHLVTPYCQCLRCSRQYDTSMVVSELDGSLDNPSYVANLPNDAQAMNQNVFPFSLNVAGLLVNLMLRYLLAARWWPVVRQQDSQFVTGETGIINDSCRPHCSFRRRIASGDSETPPYLTRTSDVVCDRTVLTVCRHFVRAFGRAAARLLHK